jgi:hypothetical protein
MRILSTRIIALPKALRFSEAVIVRGERISVRFTDAELRELGQIQWPFEADDNWRYCVEHANFSHREACEFILHVGEDPRRDYDGLPEYASRTVRGMLEYGCSKSFIDAYVAVAKAGAIRVLFWC